MPAPDSLKCEIEFVSGTWTDVSAYVDWSAGGGTNFGRTSPYSVAQSASLTLTLDNTDGRFSPLKLLLNDNTTTHPYYPNVVPRKRIRFSVVVSSVVYTRFVGFIKGWPQAMKDSFKPRVEINATDILDRLSRVTLKGNITQEYLLDSPSYFWPLTDPAGSVSAVEYSGGTPLITVGSPAWALVFGDNGPGSGDGSGVKFNGNSASVGQYLSGPTVPMQAATYVVNFNVGTVIPRTETIMFASGHGVQVSTSGVLSTNSGIIAIQVNDGGWHSVALTTTAPVYGSPMAGAWNYTASMYLDGISFGGVAIPDFGGTPTAPPLEQFMLGSIQQSNPLTAANLGYAAMFPSILSSARLQQYTLAAKLARNGDNCAGRVQRFLGYAGVASSDYNVDASNIGLSSYQASGVDVFTALQTCVDSEGGGSVVYATPSDGKVRFLNRSARAPAAPVMTLDAGGDLDGATYAPTYDDSNIVNSVEGDRATASGTASVQIVQDMPSQAAYGLISGSFTSYAQQDYDVLNAAQDKLAAQRQPGWRLGQLAVDCYTATTAGIYAAVSNALIGTRIRVTNLYVGAAPQAQVDVIVEGWSDSFGDSSFTTTFDTSPADAPARFIWDDTTYGRWQAENITLTSDITAAATSLSATTTAGFPTFTTVSARYPLYIQIDQEIMSVTVAPGGATSPQTLTVARGGQGSIVTPHAAAAAITLWPVDSWAL